MTKLPQVFLDRPIAHRALHDAQLRRPENSRAAVRSAIEHGYGIEIDLQLSCDGHAMVFHDHDMARLTSRHGPLANLTRSQLSEVQLHHSDECVPALPEILDLVAGRVPLLIELKDQDGTMGTNVGGLEAATVKALADYKGAVAVMSFNPNSVTELKRLAPDLPRGLATSGYSPDDWPVLSQELRDHLRDIPDFEGAGASFISHDARDLTNPSVAALKNWGVPILCWTVRSTLAEAVARQVADNITFEGYLA